VRREVRRGAFACLNKGAIASERWIVGELAAFATIVMGAGEQSTSLRAGESPEGVAS